MTGFRREVVDSRIVKVWVVGGAKATEAALVQLELSACTPAGTEKTLVV